MLVPIKLKCSRYQYLGHNSGYTLNALNMLRQILSGNDVILVLEDLAYTCRGIGDALCFISDHILSNP